MISFTVTYVRHAETTANKNQILQGQMDFDLSPDGQNQVKKLGGRLSNETFTHVFSSDLGRCRKTAEGIMQLNDMHRPTPQFDRRLRERCFGVFEGQAVKKYTTHMHQSNLPDLNMYTPPEGESSDDVKSRVVSFFYDMCDIVTTIDNKHERERRRVGHANESLECETNPLPMSTEDRPCVDTQSTTVIINHAMTGADQSTPDRTVQSINRGGSRSGADLSVSSPSSSPDIPLGCSWAAYRQNSSADILVVTHGGVLRAMLCYLRDVLNCRFSDGDLANRVCPNTAVTRVVVYVCGGQVVGVASTCIHDVSHLTGERPPVPLSLE